MHKCLMPIVLILLSSNATAQLDQFKTGPLIENYGKTANVPEMEQLSTNEKFSISFDVSKQAKPGAINRSLDSGARFLNMHVNAGLKVANLKLAFVIHGSAVRDMTDNVFYQTGHAEKNAQNGNIELIKTLQNHGVQFYVCGQSAAYYGVNKKDLLPGVTMSLSAMTAHAQLQQAGFTINPF